MYFTWFCTCFHAALHVYYIVLHRLNIITWVSIILLVFTWITLNYKYVYMIFTYFLHPIHVFYMYLLIIYMYYMIITCHANFLAVAWILILGLVFLWYTLLHSQFAQCQGGYTLKAMSRRIYAQGMVASFLPVSGSESEWGERGGNSKLVRNTEILWERLQAEAIALGGPATNPPNRPCPSQLRLRLIEGSVVPEHLEHLRGVRGTRHWAGSWIGRSSPPHPPSASTLAARRSCQPQRAAGAINLVVVLNTPSAVHSLVHAPVTVRAWRLTGKRFKLEDGSAGDASR